MKKSAEQTALEGQDQEILADWDILRKQEGIGYYDAKALPYHAVWIRKDIAVVISLLTAIRHYARLVFFALLAIGAILILRPLWH